MNLQYFHELIDLFFDLFSHLSFNNFKLKSDALLLNDIDILDIIEYYKETETKRDIMSNFILFIRIMKSLNIKLPDQELLYRVYANKDNLTYNLMILKNLPLYKFYNFCKLYL